MFGRSKERSFLLLIVSMIVVGLVMYLDAALSGGSRMNPFIGGGILLAQAAALLWIARSEDYEAAARIGEVAAAAPFVIGLIWAKVR
jgi:hypothetical protein